MPELGTGTELKTMQNYRDILDLLPANCFYNVGPRLMSMHTFNSDKIVPRPQPPSQLEMLPSAMAQGTHAARRKCYENAVPWFVNMN